MARLQYTIPDELHKKANMIFETQGLTHKIAIKMFYTEVVERKGFPFKPSKVEIPNALTSKTIKDARKGKNIIGPFNSPEELFKSLEG